jgi:hypothetical protein
VISLSAVPLASPWRYGVASCRVRHYKPRPEVIFNALGQGFASRGRRVDEYRRLIHFTWREGRAFGLELARRSGLERHWGVHCDPGGESVSVRCLDSPHGCDGKPPVMSGKPTKEGCVHADWGRVLIGVVFVETVCEGCANTGNPSLSGRGGGGERCVLQPAVSCQKKTLNQPCRMQSVCQFDKDGHAFTESSPKATLRSKGVTSGLPPPWLKRALMCPTSGKSPIRKVRPSTPSRLRAG